MSWIKQCKTIKETIKYLQELKDQKELIIFDYISESEIKEELCDRFYPVTPTPEQVKVTMFELDHINIFQVAVMRENENSISKSLETLQKYSWVA
jgi:hypothetical protein